VHGPYKRHETFLTPIQKKGIESLINIALFPLLQTNTNYFQQSKQNYSINLSEILTGVVRKMTLNDGIQTLS